MATRTKARTAARAKPKARGKTKPAARGAKARSSRRASAALSASLSLYRSLVGGGGYSGARSDRSALKRCTPRAGSANADAIADIPMLRARTRDLARNAPLATGALRTRVTSAVGTGLRPHAQIDRELLELTDEAADAWESAAERYFWAWAERADVAGRLQFPDLQALALASHDESGDVFALRRFVERPGDLFGFKLQLLEADRVSMPRGRLETPTFIDGVELDTDGQPVAYHVQTAHPGDLTLMQTPTWERIPARMADGEWNVLHVARMLRPDQARGVPLLAPVIEALKQLDRYTEAEIAAAVVSSLYAVFIKSDLGEDAPDTAAAEGSIDDGTFHGAIDPAREITLEPGLVVNLDPGESVEAPSPGRPNVNFEPFVLAVLRQIGVALEMPFEFLVKHFTASYSASRAALLEAWRAIKVLRAWFIRTLCQPCYDAVIGEAVARGYLDAPGFFDDPLLRRAWCATRWTGDAAGQLNPVDEIDAARKRVELGVTTIAEETSELTGGDWETKHRQRVKETVRRRRDGLDGETIAERIRTEPMAPAPTRAPTRDRADGPDDLDETDEEAERDADAARAGDPSSRRWRRARARQGATA